MKCVYPLAPQFIAFERKEDQSQPSSSCSIASPSTSVSPNTVPCPTRSSSHEISTSSSPGPVEIGPCFSAHDTFEGLSDTDLYHHYLQHTSRTLTSYQRNRKALQIGMPTLALESKPVYHSLLAISAACLGCDLISKDSPPDVNTIYRILMTGYRHYNLASEQMREAISSQSALKPEPLLASSMLLVPFATASQQLNHWVSSREETSESTRLLSTTPRDVIIMMRGIRSTVQTLASNDLPSDPELCPEMEFLFDRTPALPDSDTVPAALAPSRTHMLYPILSSTAHGAFSKLSRRLEHVVHHSNKCSNEALHACSTAFEILDDLRSEAFSASRSRSSSPPKTTVARSPEPESITLPQVAPWLFPLVYQSKNLLPTEPLTRFFLTFLVQAPQAYIDLVLPLLDQRLEGPAQRTLDTTPPELTSEQALTLDIYAHWSVLMFLVEKESWWIGELPFVTLSGMINRYGHDFLNRLWYTDGSEGEQWWPVSMLNILREIKHHR